MPFTVTQQMVIMVMIIRYNDNLSKTLLWKYQKEGEIIYHKMCVPASIL